MIEEPGYGAASQGAAGGRTAQVPGKADPQSIVQAGALQARNRQGREAPQQPGQGFPFASCCGLDPLQVGSVRLDEGVVLEQGHAVGKYGCHVAILFVDVPLRADLVGMPLRQPARQLKCPGILDCRAGDAGDGFVIQCQCGRRRGREPDRLGLDASEKLFGKLDDRCTLGEGAKKEQRVMDANEGLHIGQLHSPELQPAGVRRFPHIRRRNNASWTQVALKGEPGGSASEFPPGVSASSSPVYPATVYGG